MKFILIMALFFHFNSIAYAEDYKFIGIESDGYPILCDFKTATIAGSHIRILCKFYRDPEEAPGYYPVGPFLYLEELVFDCKNHLVKVLRGSTYDGNMKWQANENVTNTWEPTKTGGEVRKVEHAVCSQFKLQYEGE